MAGFGQPRSLPLSPLNTFVAAFAFKSGVRRWANLIGNMVSDNVHRSSGYFRGTLIIGVQSRTGRYSGGDKSIRDMTLATISPESGDVRRVTVFGGLGHTDLKDLSVSHLGIHVLAWVSSDLNPHPNPGSYYRLSTAAGKASPALIWLSTELEMFEMMVAATDAGVGPRTRRRRHVPLPKDDPLHQGVRHITRVRAAGSVEVDSFDLRSLPPDQRWKHPLRLQHMRLRLQLLCKTLTWVLHQLPG